MPSSTRTRHPAADERGRRGLLDTSVLIDFDLLDAGLLPAEPEISCFTLAELAAGPHAPADPAERARRQDRLLRTEQAFEPIPFGASVARAYGRVYAALLARGTRPRERRVVDLLIAATALAMGLPLYTRNPADFAGLEDLIDVVAV